MLDAVLKSFMVVSNPKFFTDFILPFFVSKIKWGNGVAHGSNKQLYTRFVPQILASCVGCSQPDLCPVPVLLAPIVLQNYSKIKKPAKLSQC